MRWCDPQSAHDSSLLMHATQVYLQTNQIQRHFVMKAVFVLQAAFFQGNTMYWSASARTHESSHIAASAQNVIQHHGCCSLWRCLIPPSSHIGHTDKCPAEENPVENHGLMKHMKLQWYSSLFLLTSISYQFITYGNSHYPALNLELWEQTILNGIWEKNP